MSKYMFVCFDCKASFKRDPREYDNVLCPTCGNACTNIGVKTPIPPKSMTKAWHDLRTQLEREAVDRARERKLKIVARVLDLEKEIKKLETLPTY